MGVVQGYDLRFAGRARVRIGHLACDGLATKLLWLTRIVELLQRQEARRRSSLRGAYELTSQSFLGESWYIVLFRSGIRCRASSSRVPLAWYSLTEVDVMAPKSDVHRDATRAIIVGITSPSFDAHRRGIRHCCCWRR